MGSAWQKIDGEKGSYARSPTPFVCLRRKAPIMNANWGLALLIVGDN
jgi:hypothetical protein